MFKKKIIYYFKNLNSVRRVIAKLDNDNATNIKKPKNILLKSVLRVTYHT